MLFFDFILNHFVSFGFSFSPGFEFGSDEAKVANGLAIDVAVHSDYHVSFWDVMDYLGTRLGIFVVDCDNFLFTFRSLFTVFSVFITVFSVFSVFITVFSTVFGFIFSCVFSTALISVLSIVLCSVPEEENVGLVPIKMATNGLGLDVNFLCRKL